MNNSVALLKESSRNPDSPMKDYSCTHQPPSPSQLSVTPESLSTEGTLMRQIFSVKRFTTIRQVHRIK
ncbi:hypothetical protein PIB30_068226, partial [Stylosanthes scabra]|nr:hypothetical protein [Stylosanthes scabra]